MKHCKILSRLPILLYLLMTNFQVISAQDPNAYQTLDYLNKKFKEFPYQDSFSSIYYFDFNLTPTGELRIEKNEYLHNIMANQKSDILVKKTIFRISINKIDLKESFDPNNSLYSDDNIHIYPFLKGSYYEEIYDDKGILKGKKTVASQSTDSDRNYISLYTSDAGNIQNIKNALLHLCSLVISNPTDYGVTSKVDPFEKLSESINPALASDNTSNTIKLTKTRSGLIEIPIVLNDVLKINFIFDSGASEVSISPDVALTLIKTGTVTENDWLPSQTYQFADGSTAKSKRFLLRKLLIGIHEINNIEVSISNSIEAPMLIGQNVMQKFGSITIDNDNLVLIIRKK